MTAQNLEKATNVTLIEELKKRGYFVSKVPPTASGKTFKPDIRQMSGRKYRFGVVSCTHLGSKYQQLTHLYTFYKYCKRKGVDTVLHCGDLVDGEKIYRGQEYELHTHGATAQKRYCVDNYPHVTGIKTLVIMGNHDESFYRTSGYNCVEAICAERDDMEYIGDYLAYINLDTIRIAIMHSDGGISYARSYRVQKIIEQLAPESKPHLMFVGHWHVNAMIPAYRNVEGVSIGAFQSQTPYLVRKGLMPNVSGLVVEVEVNDKGLVGVKYDWRHFYEMKKNDY
jgi:predicted phosphodiesterase